MEKGKTETKNIYTFLLWMSVSVLFGQILVLGYINLTQLQYHIGFDASGNFLKAIEIGKQGTIFTKNFENQTTLYLDSPAPIAGFLFAITGNIFLSYGIANTLIILAVLWMLYLVMTSFQLSALIKTICLNFIICPYLTPEFQAGEYNNLDYFCCMLSDAQFYACKMLIVLMVLKMVIDCEQGKRNWFLIIATELMLFISGISGGGYLLVTIVTPLFTYYIVKAFIYNSWKEMCRIKVWLLVTGAILIISGKAVAGFALHFESKDSNMTLIGLLDFWDNFSTVFLGFLDLFSALPSESNQPVFEVTGIVYLFGAFICCIYIVGTIVVIIAGLKNRAIFNQYGILFYCIAFNIIMFAVVNVKDGAAVFQIRYLLPVFLLLTIIVGVFIERLSDDLLFKKCGIICAVSILLMLDVYGDRKYIRNRHDYDTLADVADEIKKLDVPVIYVYGEYMKLESRALGIIDSGRIYKYIYPNCFNFTTHWGDYTYYDDIAEVAGKNVLISEPEKFVSMPEYIKNQYNLYKQIGRFYIYYAEVNKFDFLSGVTGDYSVDYPTSFGINILNGSLDENGSLLSDGSEGELIEGPFTEIDAGTYDFILNYEVIENGAETAIFSIGVDYNNKILGEVYLLQEAGRVSLENIEIKERGNGFSYNIYNTEGTKIRVDSFEIYKVE